MPFTPSSAPPMHLHLKRASLRNYSDPNTATAVWEGRQESELFQSGEKAGGASLQGSLRAKKEMTLCWKEGEEGTPRKEEQVCEPGQLGSGIRLTIPRETQGARVTLRAVES